MISCDKCHDYFRRKVNRRSTSFSTHPSVADVDAYFKEAFEIWVTTMVRLRETNDVARNNLRQLEVRNKELKIDNKGDYYLADIPDDFFSGLNYSIKATKGGCDKSGKYLVPHVVQSDDIQETLKDPNRKPSYEYEEVIIDEAGNSLFIYTLGEMDITEVMANYYKKITPISCPKLVTDKRYYLNPDGIKVTKNVGFEIDSTYVLNDVADIAAFLFLRDVADNAELDTQLNKIGIKYKLINN